MPIRLIRFSVMLAMVALLVGVYLRTSKGPAAQSARRSALPSRRLSLVPVRSSFQSARNSRPVRSEDLPSFSLDGGEPGTRSGSGVVVTSGIVAATGPPTTDSGDRGFFPWLESRFPLGWVSSRRAVRQRRGTRLAIVILACMTFIVVTRSRMTMYVSQSLGMTTMEASRVLGLKSWQTAAWQNGQASTLLRWDVTGQAPRGSSDGTPTVAAPVEDPTNQVTRL